MCTHVSKCKNNKIKGEKKKIIIVKKGIWNALSFWKIKSI
jgi:hypothetical protein